MSQEKVYKWLWDQKRKITVIEKINPKCDLKFKNGIILDNKVNYVNAKREVQVSYHIRPELKYIEMIS